MSSVRKSSVGVPVRATYVNLYKWPESDAEFVKSVTGRREGKVTSPSINWSSSSRRKWGSHNYQRPTVVDSYSCRQMYLRSYTFSKKESVLEKTKRCLVKVRERASLFSFTHRRNSASSEYSTSERKKKGCVVVRKLRKVSSSAVSSAFRRLLSCTTTIDVMDRLPH